MIGSEVNFWNIFDLSFHLNSLPVAIRQRRTVRSGRERCYLRCHSCSSYLGLIFLFSYHLAFVFFLFPFSLFLSHRCAQSARKLRGSLILSPSVRRWEKFLARPLKLGLKLLKEMKQIKFTVFFRSLKNYAAPLAVVLFRALRFATMRFGPFPFVFLRQP